MAISAEDLRAARLFDSIEDRELRKLAPQLKERTYAAGDSIVREGKGGIGFFIIVEGSALVTIRGVERGRLTRGDTFGELGLIDMSADRMATVTAETPVRCASMIAWDFRSFVIGHPEVAWKMLQGIAAKLRDAEERAAAAVASTTPA